MEKLERRSTAKKEERAAGKKRTSDDLDGLVNDDPKTPQAKRARSDPTAPRGGEEEAVVVDTGDFSMVPTNNDEDETTHKESASVNSPLDSNA